MKHKLNTKAQHLLFYFLSALILFQLSAPFAFHPLLRVCLALSAAPAPARSIRNLLFNLREKNLRDQYLFFLQSLSGDLSSGSSPAQAVLNAAAQAEHSLGKQAVLTRLLHRSRQLLLNQHPLSRVLEEFAEGLPLKEGKVLLFALAANEQLGEKAVVLIREAKERSAALRDLEAEARAEQFGQILQALCLTATPFVLAYLFEKMFLSFESGPRTLPATLFMVTAFILATVAVGSAGHILFPPPKRNKRPHDKSFLTVFLDSLGAAPPVRAANRHLLNRLPRFYLSKQRQLIKASHLPQEFALNPDEHGTEQMLILFHRRKFAFALLLTAVCILPVALRQISPLLLLPLFPLAWLAADLSLHESAKRYKKALVEDLPLFADLLLQHLQLGLVMRQALAAVLVTLPEEDRPLKREIARMVQAQAVGVGTAQTLLAFAVRCPVIPVQSFFLLLVQFDQTGHRDVLASLQQQKEICWNLYKDAVIREARELSGKLILPMLLDLAAVLMIAVAPALSVFMSF